MINLYHPKKLLLIFSPLKTVSIPLLMVTVWMLIFTTDIDKMKHILSWNIRGFNTNKEHLLLSNKPIAVCLQETIGPNDKEIHLPGYTILKTNTNRGNALCICSDCLYTTVSLNTPIEALAVRILLHKTVTICSVYISPSKTVSKTDLINLANQLPAPFLILGDFNGHSPRWEILIPTFKEKL